MGYTVFSDDLDIIEIDSRRPARVLSTISPNSYGVATKDHSFKEALQHSDYLVLDGVYFALAPILLQRTNIKKNQGPDVFYHFMKKINEKKGKIFFLGSVDSTLQKMKDKIAVYYPDVTVAYHSPPYKPEFEDEDDQIMIDAIKAFSPDIVFIGMTCPKQEKWAYRHKEKIDASLICCVGGVFDWYAGNYKEIHPIWWKLRLGWLRRIIQRPELIKRNIPNVYIFAKDVVKNFARKLFKK